MGYGRPTPKSRNYSERMRKESSVGPKGIAGAAFSWREPACPEDHGGGAAASVG